MCGLERKGRHLFDVSSTVLGAIMTSEWIDEGMGDTCLMYQHCVGCDIELRVDW